MQSNYTQFLQSKTISHEPSGFDVDDNELNPHLFKFQRFIVKRALQQGKFAVFADCGLGKTLIQLVWAEQVAKHTDSSVLILAPLAVAGQTIQEGEKFGVSVSRWNPSNKDTIQITNYEQLDNIDISRFVGIVIDESSILKCFDGRTRNKIVEGFSDFNYKLACTATPSPNDPMELGNHAEFLNVMSRNEMLAMFFVHDGGNTSKWRLKRHSIKTFYEWVSNWAIMLSRPHDIGFEQDGFDLPALTFIEKIIETPKRDNGRLFNDLSVNATNFNRELRLTMDTRLNCAAEIVNSSTETFIVWIKQNAEGDMLRELIPDAIEVKGSDSPEYKEEKLLGFAKNDFRVLITKSKIAQFGLNYQNCHNQIFAGLDFSFETLYQSIRRSYRFGQESPVNIYIITTDTMQNVIKAIETKQEAFTAMQKQMSLAVNDVTTKNNGNTSPSQDHITGDDYDIYLGDCVPVMKKLKTESVDLSVFSPPFANLYTYSDFVEDMGNCNGIDEFSSHFSFPIQELHRVMKTGRIVAVHCSDLPILKSKEGIIGLRDFSGILVNLFIKNGFIYHSRITIWKDPVVEMQRTKALGLLHKQVKKDSTMSRVGLPDYVLLFRKEGENNNPVSNTDIPVSTWQNWASPIWMDINQSDTLQYFSARGNNDEKHICPLQLPVIERLIALYSNERETVLSPFAGIGSEGFQALKMNRKFIGIELKESYFESMRKNLIGATEQKRQLSLV